MKVQHFFDKETSTLTYVVHDDVTLDTVIIDPVLNFNQASGLIEDRGIQDIINYIKENDLSVLAILETHAHADHLSSSQVLKQVFPKAQLGIGHKIAIVQKTFKNLFNIDYVRADASQFDILFKDYEEVHFGSLKMKAIPTPGHTPACMSYLFNDQMIFTGDALFMPDFGTGRCDFPRGSAKELYHSVTKNLYELKDDVKVYVCHDYSPNGREMRFETSIGESKKSNIHISEKTREDEFVVFREERDLTLTAPKLLLPSLQVNIDAGHIPPKEENGVSYLKLPLEVNLKSGKL